MKITNIKLANAVRVGKEEISFVQTNDSRGKPRYEAELEDHLILITDTISGSTKYTSLYNTVSFDMVVDESKKTKPDGTTIDLAPRTPKARGRGNQGTD